MMFGRLSRAGLIIWTVLLAAAGWRLSSAQPPLSSSTQEPSLLACPAGVKLPLAGNWSIAHVSPRLEFHSLPLEPMTFPPPGPGEMPRQWTIWGQGMLDPSTGRIYGAVGDHGGIGARLHIFAFDTRTRTITLSPEINGALGAHPGGFADGKIHGWLDSYGGPWLWFATYWAKYPEPSAEDFASGYRGGHIARYHVRTGEVVDEGVPVPRASWPSHRIDGARGIFYAAGQFGEFLAWDLKTRKILFAGRLPGGWSWWNRVLLLDEVSGFVYSSNADEKDPAYGLLRFSPAGNRFDRLGLPMPADEKGVRSPIRAHTARRGPDGLFWAVTQNGALFSFDPEKSAIAAAGICWPGMRRYTTSLARSPRGRYLYFLPGAHGDSFHEGSPLVQYDTKLKRFKILAFLGAHVLAKFGYLVGGTYSVVMDEAGETLYVFMNGALRTLQDAKPVPLEAFGTPALLVISIPAEERAE